MDQRTGDIDVSCGTESAVLDGIVLLLVSFLNAFPRILPLLLLEAAAGMWSKRLHKNHRYT